MLLLRHVQSFLRPFIAGWSSSSLAQQWAANVAPMASRVIYVKCSTSRTPRNIKKTRGYKARNSAKKEQGQPRTIKHLLKSKMMAHNVGNGESFFHSFGPCFWARLTWATKKLCKIGTPKQSPNTMYLPAQPQCKQCWNNAPTSGKGRKVLFWSKLWAFVILATRHCHRLPTLE